MLCVIYQLIPDVDGEPAIAQLVRSDRSEVSIVSGFRGPARLDLQCHVNAPISDLPVRQVVEGMHVKCNMKQPTAQVVLDYLEQKN